MASRSGEPHVLGLFDLDGFKHYNDTFGHPAGDALIMRLSGRLARAVGGTGAAYRMGGDEFCVLAPAPGAGEIIHRAAAALAETGDGFRIGASLGVVALPHDAASASAALRLADRRITRRRTSTAPASRDMLLRAIAEHEPDLHEHSLLVAELALRVAALLGLDAASCASVARAAELHDVGKVAIPYTILRKPGPLDPAERSSCAATPRSARRSCAPRRRSARRPRWCARATSAGTAAAIPTASPATRSRSARGSSRSATPTARCARRAPTAA